MKSVKEIKQGLKEMETRKTSYLLDMTSYKTPNSVVYDTEIIRKLEVTDATIHTLLWVLYSEKKPAKQKSTDKEPVKELARKKSSQKKHSNNNGETTFADVLKHAKKIYKKGKEKWGQAIERARVELKF